MGLRHVFGDKPIPVILDFLLVHRFWDYPIGEMERATGISYRTLQTVVPALVKKGIIKETRTVGNAKFYAINLDSKPVRKMDELAIAADLEFGGGKREKAMAVKAIARR